MMLENRKRIYELHAMTYYVLASHERPVGRPASEIAKRLRPARMNAMSKTRANAGSQDATGSAETTRCCEAGVRNLRGAEIDGNKWRCNCGKLWQYVEDEAEGGAWLRSPNATAPLDKGCDFYKGIEWFACWLLDNAEGETITEEQLRPWAVKAWSAAQCSPNAELSDSRENNL